MKNQRSLYLVISRMLLVSGMLVALSAEGRMFESENVKEARGSSSGGSSWSDGMRNRWDQLTTSIKTWWDSDSSKTTKSVPTQTPPTQQAAVQQTQTAPGTAQSAQQTQQAPNSADTAPAAVAPVKAGTIPTELPKKKNLEAVSTPAVEALRQTPALKIEKAGRKADPNLRKSSAGVPVFDLEKTIPVSGGKSKKKESRLAKVRVDRIPLLDVGEEATVRHQDFAVPEIKIGSLAIPKFTELKSVALMTEKEEKTWLTTGVEMAQPPKKVLLTFLGDQQVATLEKVQAVKWIIGSEKPIALAAVEPFTAEDLKALAAMILVDKKDQCHLVAGLLSDLSTSKNASYSSMSNFHLGLCLHEMGLYSESVHRLLRVIEGGNKSFVPRAIKMVVKDLPVEFEMEVAEVLRKVSDETLIPKEAMNGYHYVLAKGYLKKTDNKSAESHALKVVDGPLYAKAQYVAAVAEYALGKVDSSLERQKKLLKVVEEKGGDSTLAALIALNLGRTSYMEKRFDEAAQYFLKIRKDNPLWIQALTEQGWAQLQSKDHAGAIGNMYSIHSPFFKSVYKPESFVVRSIGYLNICQYGDAYRTLSQLESMYRPWMEKMADYRKNHKSATDYYSSVLKYLKSPSDATVDGLPAQVLREMARHRDFLNTQEAINNRVDELEQYGHINGLIEKDKAKVKWKSGKAAERAADFDNRLKHANTIPDSAKFINEWKAQLAYERDLGEYYKFVMEIYEDGRKGLASFRTIASSRLNEKKEKLKAAAAKTLEKRLALMTSDLSSILENNEFLRYEVFAGSGENIRVQVAVNEPSGEKPGMRAPAEAAKRVPANVKPKSKELQWAFDGEYWEDEIGNYRSSLKDNCQHRAAAGQ